MSPKKIVGVLIVLASFFLSGCRITLTPIVSLSSLQDGKARTTPVVITAKTQTCTKDFLNETADLFKATFQIKPVECRKKGQVFEAVWETEIPLLRSGDESKIPRVPVSIYYSKNHTVIMTLKSDFLNDISEKMKLQGADIKDNEIYIAFLFRNDTSAEVNIAVENVFINGVPVGRDMAIFRIRPSGSALVRLSDITTNSLLLGGVEAAGVFPALEPKVDSDKDDVD